jgi:hypothetical protein
LISGHFWYFWCAQSSGKYGTLKSKPYGTAFAQSLKEILETPNENILMTNMDNKPPIFQL